MQNTKVFTEVANDGRFPYIDSLPLLMQGTIDRLTKLTSVGKITAYNINGSLQANLYLKPGANPFIQISQVFGSIDKLNLQLDRMVIHGTESKVTMKLSTKKQLAN
jgi:hypothetical protein